MVSERQVGYPTEGPGPVIDSPVTERYMWLVGIIDGVEDAGRMHDFRIVDNQYNSYREAIIDKACVEAFEKKNPTKGEVFPQRGPMVARMFARVTQGRANKSRLQLS